MCQFVHTISVADYNHLRRSVGWAVVEETQAQAGICNSFFLVAAVDNGHTVGLTRVVSDGGYFMLIADVIVLPDYQGKGIGRAMIEQAMARIRAHIKPGQSAMINLMAAKGKESFYKQFGFIERPNDRSGAGMAQYIHYSD